MYDYLIHHGIKGQKWGVRRYQNEDGSLTDAGRKRKYGDHLDINDKSRKNIVKIRIGEAKRNYDIAKNQGADKKELKDLKDRIKDAKRIKKGLKAFERGEKLVNMGMSIEGAKSEQRYELGKAKTYNTLKAIDGTKVFSPETATRLKLERQKRDIQKYYDHRKEYTKNNIGGQEYQEVLRRRGN